MIIKYVLFLILFFSHFSEINCQKRDTFSIQKDRIKTIFKIVNRTEKTTINDYLELFFVNSELEKRLFINKKTAEGISEEKSDSIFDWVIMQNREKNESLVLNKLKAYLSPIYSYKIANIYDSTDSYTIYEVNVILKRNENKPLKYYFQVSKLSEETYPIIDIFDNSMKSIITNEQRGVCS